MTKQKTRKCAFPDGCDKMVDYSGCRHKTKYCPEHQKEMAVITQNKCHKNWVKRNPIKEKLSRKRNGFGGYDAADYGSF